MIGNKIFIWFANSMPFSLSHIIWDWFSNKTSMCYSNFPGPKKAFNFGEIKAYTIAPFAPIVGDLTSGIAGCSVAGTLCFGMMTDMEYIKDPDLFM